VAYIEGDAEDVRPKILFTTLLTSPLREEVGECKRAGSEVNGLNKFCLS